jgi:hypothetical protein
MPVKMRSIRLGVNQAGRTASSIEAVAAPCSSNSSEACLVTKVTWT